MFWLLFCAMVALFALMLIWGTVDLLRDSQYLRVVRLWAAIMAWGLLGWFSTPLWQFFTRRLARIRAMLRSGC
jgi:hypothetical protein